MSNLTELMKQKNAYIDSIESQFKSIDLDNVTLLNWKFLLEKSKSEYPTDKQLFEMYIEKFGAGSFKRLVAYYAPVKIEQLEDSLNSKTFVLQNIIKLKP